METNFDPRTVGLIEKNMCVPNGAPYKMENALADILHFLATKDPSDRKAWERAQKEYDKKYRNTSNMGNPVLTPYMQHQAMLAANGCDPQCPGNPIK